MNGQPAAEFVIRFFAEKIKQLTVNHGNQKIEGGVRIAHDQEQRRSLRIALLSAAQRVQLQFVIQGDLPKLLNIKRRKASASGYVDALCRFAGAQLVFAPLTHGKVIRIAFAQFPKGNIHVVFKGFIVLTHLHGVNEFQKRGEILFLLRRFVIDVSDQRRVEQRFRLEPEVVAAFALALRIADQGVYQLQDVLFAVDIGEGIVVH